MGWIKNAAAKSVTDRAQAARAAGGVAYTTTLSPMKPGKGGVASPLGWSEQINAIEECGWVLGQWSVAQDASGAMNAYPVFRRAELA